MRNFRDVVERPFRVPTPRPTTTLPPLRPAGSFARIRPCVPALSTSGDQVAILTDLLPRCQVAFTRLTRQPPVALGQLTRATVRVPIFPDLNARLLNRTLATGPFEVGVGAV